MLRRKITYKPLAFLIAVLFLPTVLPAQSTRVRGRVTDAADGTPMQFVSVVFPGTTTGITTDEAGIYTLETRDTVSRVQATMVGYASQTKPLIQGGFNQIDFALEAVEFGIGSVVITPGDNPAHPILRGVIRRKPQNDPDLYDSYTCATYTKMQLDLTNIKPRFRSKRLQRNFGFVFDYIDTSALTGQAYLPAMISEATADYYHSRRNPAVSREIIRASRVSGVEDSFAIAQFTGQMHGNVNFYANYIDIFNVRFASPLSDSGLAFYDYFLVDSMQVEGRKTYKIRFHPKRLATPVLDGEVNIDSASYALQSASARMPKGVNVNWIKHLRLENDNRIVADSTWFRHRDRVSAEFSIATGDSSKLTSFIGTREVVYSDVRVGVPIPDEVARMDNNVVIGDDEEVSRTDEAFWEQVRPYRLSEKEKGIYSMVDSVQNVPLYRNIYTLINTVIVGYWNTKYIGIGPYYKLASFNKLEGFRMQPGFRTTTAVSKRIRLSGYAAYGTRDGMFKGGGSVELAFNRRLTRKLTVSGRHDVMQLGAGQNALTESNILSSLLSRGDSRLPHPEDLRQPLRAAGASRRPDRKLRIGRRAARRDAYFEEREHLPPALRQAVHGHGLPRPDARIHGRRSRHAERQLRILPARRGHPLQTRTAAAGLFQHHAAGRQNLRQGPLSAAQAPRRQRHLFLRSQCLLVHEFLRIRIGRMGGALLRTPLQRHPAGPHSARQETQVARSAGLQGRVGHALEGERRQSA